VFRKTLDGLGALFFLILVVLPAPLFGGRDVTTLFLIRVLILSAAFLFLLRLVFYGNDFFLQSLRGIRLPLLLFLLFVLYSFAQAHGGSHVFSKIMPGSIDRFETKSHATQLIFYLLFFLLGLHFFSSQKRVRLVMVLVAVQTAFLIALGYFQRNAVYGGLQEIYGWHAVQKDSQFFSSFFNKNYYGAFLLLASYLFLGPLFYWFRHPEFKWPLDSRQLENLLFVLILPAALVSMLHVRARAAFAMELCAVASLWIAGFLTEGRKRAFAAFVLFGASVYALAVVLSPSLWEPYRFLARDFMFRWTLWKESVPLFFDFPYFGTGLGTFKWISRRYQIQLAEDYWMDHTHNDYLELLTDAGAIGFLIFMAAIVLLLIISLRKCLKSESRWNRTVGIVSLMAVVSLGAISTVDFYLRTPAIAMLFAVHLGILVNCGAMYSGERGGRASESTPLKIMWVMAGIVLLGSLGVYAYHTYRSEAMFDRYEQAQVFNRDELQSKNLRPAELTKAVLAVPENPRGWKLLGDFYFRKAALNKGRSSEKYFQKSIEAYRTLTVLAPTRPDAWLSLGKVEIMRGDREAGFKDRRQGLRLSPYNRDIYLSLLVDYLRAAEVLADSKSQHEAYLQEAALLIQQASSLTSPFTLTDFDYLGGASGKLSQEDRTRVYALLERLSASSI